MAKSALLKSSIGKKYWMALTGLFLCLFLAGHLIGNLQLIFGTPLQFNQYALFMSTNPAIKVLSYTTYFSILFHAVDGIMLTIQNKKARPIGYAKETPSANSTWSSRNMAVLGTLILVFIVVHMVNFWAVMHFDKNMPLQSTTVEMMGQKQDFYLTTNGGYMPVAQIAKNATEAQTSGAQMYFDGKDIYNTQAKLKIAETYKDLYKITIAFFKDPKFGLIATLLYVISMAVLAFHLLHGFQSSFQSLGINNKFTPAIKCFGKLFAIIVPALFAIIPLYIHFFSK